MWLKIGGGLMVLAVIGLVVWLYGGARYKQGKSDERTAWQAKVVEAERQKLVAYQAGVASVQRADANYIETIREKVVPITKTIIERTAAYAATPEGAAICLLADRVSLLSETRSALFPTSAPSSTSGSTQVVPAERLGN